jgi:uncharacterized protein YjbI with pentapeptide repeats
MTFNIPLPIWEAALFFTLAIAVWQIPRWQTKTFTEELEPKDRANLEDANRRTFIQFLGGLFFFVTAYLSWRNLQTAENKEVNDRFSKAVELLGNDRLEGRLGGIYLLERITKDSAKYHWTVMEVLTSYIRDKVPVHQRAERLSTDIQAALTVIGRRNASNDSRTKPLDLRGVNLQGAYLAQANFNAADFRGSNLSDTNFEQALLVGANFSQCQLSRASFIEAALNEANFSKATLKQANLAQAHLIAAVLLQADLQSAILDQASLSQANLVLAQLQGTSFVKANLNAATLIGADLTDTIFSTANLREADLRSTVHLLPEQVQTAHQWEMAIYDVEMQEQLGLSPKTELSESQE